jgi:hypothetical protein
VHLESHCALRQWYVDLVVSIDANGCHFQHQLYVHSDLPNADLQKVFVNKIKQVQACIDAHGHHFPFYKCSVTFQTQICRKCL